MNLAGHGLHSIPDSIYKYYGLEELYLGSSGFIFYGPSSLPSTSNNIKEVPIQICKLKKLKKLDLTFNKLVRVPDLSCCEELTDLNISFNDKIETIENITAINAIKNLKYLILIGTKTTWEDIAYLKTQIRETVTIIYNTKEYTDYLMGNYR